MANRTAKFVSGVVATLLAGAALAILPRSAAAAPDECLLKPNGPAPQGQHWYYRVDHTKNKRQCWYLRAEGDVAPQATSSDAPAGSTSPTAASVAQRSIQDARAEFPAPLPESDRSPAPDQQTPLAAADPAAMQNGQDADTANSRQTAVDSRWPDPSASAPTARPPTSAQAVADARPANKAVASPGVATLAAAAAAAKPAGSLQMLLLVIAGALALAGITASIIFRVGHARQRASRMQRRVNWGAADGPTDELGTPPWLQEAESSSAIGDFPREPAQAVQPADPDVDRITELLVQLMKQGPKLDRTISAIGSADYGQDRPDQPGVPA